MISLHKGALVLVFLNSLMLQISPRIWPFGVELIPRTYKSLSEHPTPSLDHGYTHSLVIPMECLIRIAATKFNHDVQTLEKARRIGVVPESTMEVDSVLTCYGHQRTRRAFKPRSRLNESRNTKFCTCKV